MKNRLLIFVLVLAQFFAIVPSSIAPSKAYANSLTNLVWNPGFEADDNFDSFPDNWTKIANQDFTTSATQNNSEAHSGTKSLSMSIDASNPIGQIESNLIPVRPGVTYQFTNWAKTNGVNGALIGLTIFNAEGKMLEQAADGKSVHVTDFAPAATIYPNAAWGTEFTSDWKKYSSNYKAQFPEIAQVKIVLRSEYINGTNGSGQLFFDDFEFSQTSAIGCANDSTCINFATNGLTENGVSIEGSINTEQAVNDGRSVRNILPAYDGPGTENDKPAGSLQVSFPSAGIALDTNGFPMVPMALEINYKQSFRPHYAWADPTSPNYHITTSAGNTWQPIVSSKVNYKHVPLIQLGGLVSDGFGGWRTSQFAFPVNSYQNIRSDNGYFNFSIGLTGGDIIPVDYIALKTISDENLALIQAEERFLVGRSDEFVETNPVPSQDFLWYRTSIMKPVYKNSYPAASEINQPLSASSAWGEIEPLTYSIFTKQDVSLTFTTSDLSNGSAKISKDQIELRQIIYETKYYGNNGGSRDSAYRNGPDRVVKFTTADIKANNSQQFWVTVKVPEKIPGGTYSGNITINNCPANASCNIPVSLNILPFKLSEPESKNIAWDNLDTEDVFPAALEDLRDHYISSPIMGLSCIAGLDDPNNSNPMPVYNFDNFEKYLTTFKEAGFVKDYVFVADIGSILTTLRGLRSQVDKPLTTDTWELAQDPSIQAMFLTVAQNVVQIANKHGVKDVYFSFIDEIDNNPDRRIEAQALLPIVKSAGGKTWQTYHNNFTNKAFYTKFAPSYKGSYDSCEQNGTDCTKYVKSLDEFIDLKVFTLTEETPKKIPDLINSYIGSFGYYTTYANNGRLLNENRFLSGIGATATDSKVVANYAYDHKNLNFYDDFDRPYTFSDTYTYADYILSYPNWDGSMSPSTAFEGLREGVKDAKYIATLENEILLNSKDPKKFQIIDEAKKYLLNISAQALEFNYPVSNPPDFDQIRAKVIDYIQKLHTSPLVVVPNKKYAGKGSKVTFDVSFTNRTTSAVTDITVSVPTTADFKPVAGSATESGTVTDDKIEWKVGRLEPGQMFKAQYAAVMQ